MKDWKGDDIYALLDGEDVLADAISPKLHRYLGMYRPPIDPNAIATCAVLCRCGRILQFREEGTRHYKDGCWDVPQYVSITPTKA
jgi:hypothetical protein